MEMKTTISVIWTDMRLYEADDIAKLTSFYSFKNNTAYRIQHILTNIISAINSSLNCLRKECNINNILKTKF
jgi:hypothetical protein